MPTRSLFFDGGGLREEPMAQCVSAKGGRGKEKGKGQSFRFLHVPPGDAGRCFTTATAPAAKKRTGEKKEKRVVAVSLSGLLGRPPRGCDLTHV